MSETLWSWLIGLGLLAVFVVPYVYRFLHQERRAQSRRMEAQSTGADKPLTQHPIIDISTCIGCGTCVSVCPEGEVLGLINGKASLINGAKCVGHERCAEACPVGGITVGLGDIAQREDIPQLSEVGETTIPNLFIVGELGGISLIRNAVSQGQRTIDYIASQPREQNPDLLDVLIVGAGPAGLSASLGCIQNNLRYLLIDQYTAGGTICQYPRRKLTLVQPVEIPLYGVLDRSEYRKEELLAIWEAIIQQFNVNIHSEEKLIDVRASNGVFEVVSSKNTYRAKQVVLALGRRGTPRKLGVPGEELEKVMYRLIDAETYQNENILLVGGGDSAVEAAIGLAHQSGNRITISYRRETFFRLKSKNEARIRQAMAEGSVLVLFNSQVKSIAEQSVQLEVNGEIVMQPNDYVFILIGGEPPFKLLKQIGIEFGVAGHRVQPVA